MPVTETCKRKLNLKRETVASFLPEGTKPSDTQGRVQFKTRTSTECGTASNTNDGSGTYCTCC